MLRDCFGCIDNRPVHVEQETSKALAVHIIVTLHLLLQRIDTKNYL